MYEEMLKFFTIDEEVPLNFLIYEENCIFFFISAPEHPPELTVVTDTEPQMIICRGRWRTNKAFALFSKPP
jgi:hypothetical protein